jgi:hypothetical protein
MAYDIRVHVHRISEATVKVGWTGKGKGWEVDELFLSLLLRLSETHQISSMDLLIEIPKRSFLVSVSSWSWTIQATLTLASEIPLVPQKTLCPN